MEVGWYLPVLASWKAVLLLEDDHKGILECFEGRNESRIACRGISNGSVATLENMTLFLKEIKITRRWILFISCYMG